jgi:hypothetical protein
MESVGMFVGKFPPKRVVTHQTGPTESKQTQYMFQLVHSFSPTAFAGPKASDEAKVLKA